MSVLKLSPTTDTPHVHGGGPPALVMMKSSGYAVSRLLDGEFLPYRKAIHSK